MYIISDVFIFPVHWQIMVSFAFFKWPNFRGLTHLCFGVVIPLIYKQIAMAHMNRHNWVKRFNF